MTVKSHSKETDFNRQQADLPEAMIINNTFATAVLVVLNKAYNIYFFIQY